jgi:hypothetical protein
VHSGSKPAKMAAAGECVVGVSFGYAGISQKANGAPVEVIFPVEGSGWDMEANALMKKDSIDPATLTFLDWAISDAAKDLYKLNYPIIATGGDGSYEGYESDPVEQLIDNDFTWVANNRDAILSEWITNYDSKSAAESRANKGGVALQSACRPARAHSAPAERDEAAANPFTSGGGPLSRGRGLASDEGSERRKHELSGDKEYHEAI